MKLAGQDTSREYAHFPVESSREDYEPPLNRHPRRLNESVNKWKQGAGFADQPRPLGVACITSDMPNDRSFVSGHDFSHAETALKIAGAPGPALLGTGESHRPHGAQAPSAPPQVAGCPRSLAFGDRGKLQTSWRASAVCPTAGGRVPPVPRFWGPGKATDLMARKRRLPHRRWPGAPGPALLGTGESHRPHGAQAPSAPPQVATACSHPRSRGR
jgi:hypothetical protein